MNHKFAKFFTLILSFAMGLGFLSVQGPSELFAMSNRFAGSEVCEPSSKIKSVKLISPDKKLTAEFKVPLQYMSMRFEREGKVDGTLTLDTQFEDSTPRCQNNGATSSFEGSLSVQIIVTSKKEASVDALNKNYSNDEFIDVVLEKYPNFKIRDFKGRDLPNSASQYSRLVGVFPVNDSILPVSYILQCDQLPDLKSFWACNLQFLHRETLLIKATFHSSKLNELPAIFERTTKLVEKFSAD